MADTTVKIRFDAKDNASAPFAALVSKMNDGGKAMQSVVSQLDGSLGGLVGKINGTARSLQALGSSQAIAFGASGAIQAAIAVYDLYRKHVEEVRKAEADAARERIDAGRRALEVLKEQQAAIDAQLRATKELASAESAKVSAQSGARRSAMEAHWMDVEARVGALDARQRLERDAAIRAAGLDDREDAAAAARAAIDAESRASRRRLSAIAARRSEAIGQYNETLRVTDNPEVRKANETRRAELERTLAALDEERVAERSRLAALDVRLQANEIERRTIDDERRNLARRLELDKRALDAERSRKAAEDARAADEARRRALEQAGRERASREGALRASLSRSLSATLSQRMSGAQAMGAADVARMRALVANGTLRSVRGGYVAATQDAAERRARKTESYQDEMRRIAREIRDKFKLTAEEYARI